MAGIPGLQIHNLQVCLRVIITLYLQFYTILQLQLQLQLQIFSLLSHCPILSLIRKVFKLSPAMSKLPSISSLMSPPEAKPFESFDQPIDMIQNLRKDAPVQDLSAVRILPSPPESPWQKLNHNAVQNDAASNTRESNPFDNDPILFPSDNAEAENGSLFEETPEHDARTQLVDRHMRYRQPPSKTKGTSSRRLELPTKEEYLLMVNWVSKINQVYNRNPAAYLKRAREEVNETGQYSKRPRWTSKSAALATAPDRPRNKLTRPPALVYKQSSRTAGSEPYPSTQHSLSSESRTKATRTRKSPPVKKQDQTVFNFDAIPDYCPPTSSLPPHPRSLSVEWQGNALNLSDDPHRGLLHDAEIYLASRLRLSCASYLCVKRRIFVGRVNNFVKGKKFTKTDAQSCGHIDVNKSSKIWAAYEKVGWFDRKYFENAIQEVAEATHCYDPALQCTVPTNKLFAT